MKGKSFPFIWIYYSVHYVRHDRQAFRRHTEGNLRKEAGVVHCDVVQASEVALKETQTFQVEKT